MGYQLQPFADVGLSEALLGALIAEHEGLRLARLERLWTYYRNPMSPLRLSGAAGKPWGRCYRQGQEQGLPGRLTGRSPSPLADDRTPGNREIVVENDIAWRVHAMVDFMFGRPIRLRSRARDSALRAKIERALDRVWEASGGIGLLQDIALLGHVYGHVDLLVAQREGEDGGTSADRAGSRADADAGTPSVRIEVIEPTRGIPLLGEDDFRRLDAYIIRYRREGREVDSAGPSSVLRWLVGASAPGPAHGRRRLVTVTHVLSGAQRQVYEDDGRGGGATLVESEPNTLTPGRVPVVHIQNLSQPLAYEGQGEVEPLIPLQDELNTRLSDRASRVTLQSFKMYLARGIDGFASMPVGPGQVISTDNPEAKIDAFGGDASSPSEESHIEEIREGLDKASGVPPLATGVVRAKVGNLTSENALRITLTGLLSKTGRKRITYGRGLAEACQLVLTGLSELGELVTDPADRAVEVVWPDPLPRNREEELRDAEAKLRIGVPAARVLEELGYGERDEGVE